MQKAGSPQYPIGWPEVGKVLLWGSLLGFGGRGAVGLYRMAKRRMKEKEESQKGEELKQMMTTPGPDALKSFQDAPKVAAAIAPAPLTPAGPKVSPPMSINTKRSGEPFVRHPMEPAPVVNEDPDFDANQSAAVQSGMQRKAAFDKAALHPLPASLLMIGAGAGGLYGGWQLADKLMDQERIKSLDEDIEEAKQQYEAALRGKARLDLVVPKMAAFIDKMAEAHERGETVKDAGFMDVLPYLIYTTLAAAVAGEAHSAYKSQARASPEAIKIEAMKNAPRSRRLIPVEARLAKPLKPEEEETTAAAF